MRVGGGFGSRKDKKWGRREGWGRIYALVIDHAPVPCERHLGLLTRLPRCPTMDDWRVIGRAGLRTFELLKVLKEATLIYLHHCVSWPRTPISRPKHAFLALPKWAHGPDKPSWPCTASPWGGGGRGHFGGWAHPPPQMKSVLFTPFHAPNLPSCLLPQLGPAIYLYARHRGSCPFIAFSRPVPAIPKSA